MLQPAITPKFDWDTHKFRCAQCPLLGVKRTCSFALQMSAFDPKRTFQSGRLMFVLDERRADCSQLRKRLHNSKALVALHFAAAVI